MYARALSPTHITGFFEIRDEYPEPLRRGSRGAGVCLALEVETEVQTMGEARRVTVEVNGAPSAAEVSRAVANELLALSSKPNGLRVRQLVPVPVGSGFGTSGAAALGVALAGSEALGLNLSPLEAAQLAHRVEVELKTGLGTVAAEFYGGLEVRVKEGAPGFGEVARIPLAERYSVVALHNGPLQTSKLLLDPEYRTRINSVGGIFSDEILHSRSLDTFLRLSHEFSGLVGLANEELAKAMTVAEDYGYLLGMAMFGHTLFTIVKENETREVAQLMSRFAEGRLIMSVIGDEGARLA